MLNHINGACNTQAPKSLGIEDKRPIAQAALRFGNLDEFTQANKQIQKEQEAKAEAKRKAEQQAKALAEASKRNELIKEAKLFLNERGNVLEEVIATRKPKFGKPATFTAYDLLVEVLKDEDKVVRVSHLIESLNLSQDEKNRLKDVTKKLTTLDLIKPTCNDPGTERWIEGSWYQGDCQSWDPGGWSAPDQITLTGKSSEWDWEKLFKSSNKGEICLTDFAKILAELK